MNNKELFWKTALKFWISGFVFWIIYTTIFLIIEGWHIKATHPVEIFLDKIVVEMWRFAFGLTAYTCIKYLLKLTK